MTDNAAIELEIVRTLDAPRALVWRAWSVKENLEQWWCPKPWKAEFTGFDMRPGGAFDTVMRGPDGEEYQYYGVFLEVVPQERIAFTDVLMSGWRPAEKPFLGFAAIITMEDEGERTRYRARALHKTPEDAKKHDEMGFSDGWNTAISQLEAIARGLAR